MAKELRLPVYVLLQMPASELLEWRALESIEHKELEDAQRIAKGKPPKHYPPSGTPEAIAKKQFTSWVNAFQMI